MRLVHGDARTLDELGSFDIVLQSTVLSSILDDEVQQGVADAMWRAIELENIAHQYIYALQIGGPVILTDAQIEEVGRKGFASTYGSHGRGQ